MLLLLPCKIRVQRRWGHVEFILIELISFFGKAGW